MDLSKLWSDIVENVGLIAVMVIVAAVIVAAAKLAEMYFCHEKKVSKAEENSAKTRKIVIIGMLSAIAFVLQFFEFSLPFIAPSFYELDFSEVPVLISAFALGPVAGVITEFVKNLLKLFIRGTSTAFVGDFANFVIGCSLVLPASVVYWRSKTKKNAMIGCAVGTLFITLVGSLFNAFYLLPAFSKLFGMPLDTIIAMGAAIFPSIENFSIYHFVFCCVAPINLLKGVSVSLIVMLIYKPISKILHNQI